MTVHIGSAARSVVEDVRRKRDLTPVANALAEIMVNDQIDVGDEREVERVVRTYCKYATEFDIDHYVAVCPDIARQISASRNSTSNF